MNPLLPACDSDRAPASSNPHQAYITREAIAKEGLKDYSLRRLCRVHRGTGMNRSTRRSNPSKGR